MPVGSTLFSIALVWIEEAAACQMEWLTQRVNLRRAAEVAYRRCFQDTESHSHWADRVITDVGRVQVHRKEVEREIEREVRKISNIFYICLFIHTTRE